MHDSNITTLVSHFALWFWWSVIVPSKWSAGLTVLGIGGWLLVALKRRVGWVVNIVNQGLWVAYGTVFHQYFFYLSALFLTIVFVIGFWKAGRKGSSTAAVPAAAPARAA